MNEKASKDFRTSANRIKELRQSRGLSQNDLAAILNVSRTAIGKYEAAVSRPSSKNAEKMAAYFGVSVDFLLGRAVDFRALSNYIGEADRFIKVPIIGSVKCGPGGFAYQYIEGMETIPADESHTDIVAFRCRGDSMNGLGIFEGDIAFVHLQPVIESGELAVVVVDGEEGMLKRVIRRGNALILESANPAYSSRVFIGDETNLVKIVGKVLWVKKTF